MALVRITNDMNFIQIDSDKDVTNDINSIQIESDKDVSEFMSMHLWISSSCGRF